MRGSHLELPWAVRVVSHTVNNHGVGDRLYEADVLARSQGGNLGLKLLQRCWRGGRDLDSQRRQRRQRRHRRRPVLGELNVMW